MDYLTLALLLFTLGVVMLLAEVLLPTGGLSSSSRCCSSASA
ncbi:MAG TPA: hypothetical protein VM529_07520 [Gemmata sp.]|nr:hypothetical protein [Gemmata sp.]